MDYSVIISLILFIIISAVIIKIVKSIFKAIAIVITILGLVCAMSAYFVYQDVADFQEGWQNQPKLFILHDNGFMLTAFKSMPGAAESLPAEISKEEITNYKEALSNKEYSKIIGDNYKIFLMDYKAFTGVETINIGKTDLSNAQIKKILSSATPTRDFANIALGTDLPLAATSEKDEQTKSLLFAALFANVIKDKGVLFIFEELKNGNIEVYPDSAIIKALRNFPYSLVKQLFTQGVEAGKEGITAAATLVDEAINN
ncbi:MAG: hypothetical protein WC471_02680 [Candidatus Woesearchaeota archaeon]